MLPTFLVIGAQKSGTSSVWQYLRRHPQVFMPLKQESAYFSGHNMPRGQRWYEEQFGGSESYLARGECSPQYTMYPTFKDVPERIAPLIPDVRLIYVVRHPVERMRSHYQHRFSAGVERAPIDRALLEEPHYLNTSRYAMQIDRYMQYFERAQLLVILSEELRRDRAAVLRRVFEFLGVDSEWWTPALDEEFNVSASRRLRRPIVTKVMSQNVALQVAERIPPQVRNSLRVVTHRSPPTAKLAISEEVKMELEDRLRDDVAHLRDFLSPEFDGWGIA